MKTCLPRDQERITTNTHGLQREKEVGNVESGNLRNDKVATTYIHIYILVCVCTSWFVQFERDEIHPNISMPNNSPYSVTILNRGERNCRKEVRKYVKRRKSRNEAVIPDKGHRKFSECLCSRGGGNKLELITA